MPDTIFELLVVSYFGNDVASVRTQLEDESWRVRHTQDLASLKVELARSRPHVVLVDRWLLRDEAPDCLRLARTVHHVPGLLMVGEHALLGGALDFDEPVDGVLEKPLRKEPLLEQLRQLTGPRKEAPPPAPGDPDPQRVPTPTPEPEIPDPQLAPGSLEAQPAPAPGTPDPEPATEPEPEPTPVGSNLDRTLGAARLLDEVRETLRRLGEVIQVDSISGLLFRDFFLERAHRETKRAARYGEPLGAMMIDIDDFKAVNDRHGHDAGNEVLATLGAVVIGSVRRDLDFACRLHGDEFAILLPCTPLAGARALADRLVERVRESGGEVPFSISIGVHALEGEELDGDGLGRLLEAADQALLTAKRAGKGRVHPEAAPPAAAESGGRPVGAAWADEDVTMDLGGDVPMPPGPVPTACPGGPVPVEAPAMPADAGPEELASVSEPGEATAVDPEPAGPGTGSGEEEKAEKPAPASEDDVLAAALAEAAAALAREEDLRDADEFRGQALLVSPEPEVAEILAGFLRKRGLPVEVTSDLASALTLLDSLEFFLVMADTVPGSAEARAFRDAAHRIDPALHVFLFVAEGESEPEEPETPTLHYVRKPFLLSDLYLRASRAREDYHLRQARD